MSFADNVSCQFHLCYTEMLDLLRVYVRFLREPEIKATSSLSFIMYLGCYGICSLALAINQHKESYAALYGSMS